MIYVVIDTNVLVAALLSKHLDSSTVIVRDYLLEGVITPLFNYEIFAEYFEVLHRPRLHLPTEKVNDILAAISQRGITLERTYSDKILPDPKDLVFYEVALSKEGSYLVTGNTKHFPKKPLVVSPAELLKIIEKQQ